MIGRGYVVRTVICLIMTVIRLICLIDLISTVNNADADCGSLAGDMWSEL